MQEGEQALERGQGGRPGGGVAFVEARLDRLGVPVAEVVEGDVVEPGHDAGVVEGAEALLDLGAGGFEAGQDPALDRLGGALAGRLLADVRDDQARDVPELVGELAPLLDGAVGEAHVLGRGHLEQAVAHRVGALLRDHLERVDAGAEALGHAPSVGGEHRRVDDHILEGHLADQLQAGEDHPVLPQADDLARRRLQVAGVEAAQVGRLVGPAEGGERPQRRGEPGVEHVLAAGQPLRSADGAGFGCALFDRQVAVGALPDRQLVAPPELARDAPVGGVLERLDREAVLGLGVEADALLAQRLQRRLLQLLHRAPPLQRDTRLDPALAALAEGDGMLEGLARDQLAAVVAPVRMRSLASSCVSPASAGTSSFISPSGPITVVLGKAVGAADLEVERVVARGDLERAGPELRIDMRVGDHRHVAVDEGNHDLLADERLVALVVRVHGNRHVGRDRGRAHGGDVDLAAAVGERVADGDELVARLHVHELEVGERGLVEGAPVDDPVVPVDPALLVEVDEEAQDGAGVALVHGEALAPVVERGADAPELGHDLAAVLVQPLPDARLEGLAPELLAAAALGRQVLLDRVLGRDAGVVVAGLEEDVEALHPLHAHDRVAERELERVAHVQLAGDVRRRVRVDEGGAGRIGIGVVETLFLPGLLPALLDALGLVERVHGGGFYG